MVDVPTPRRVALMGGDSRQTARWDGLGEAIIFFQAPRYGGNGELRRLQSALRAGSFDLVVILARWNGHSATKQVRAICKRLGIPVQVLP